LPRDNHTQTQKPVLGHGFGAWVWGMRMSESFSDTFGGGTLGKVETLARIGSTLLGAQFPPHEQGASALLGDEWVLGYCFGLFDAMAQYARLDQFTEGVTLMRSGFALLVGVDAEGSVLFDRALEHMGRDLFASGMAAGEADLMTWAGHAQATPEKLAAHFVAQEEM
jgi:hypothetical protein